MNRFVAVHESVVGRLCCKTPKMAWSDFSAKRPNKRQLPVDVPSSALPKLPVSSSPVAAVPHTIIRSLRPQPGKFVFSDPKRVLQHNRHFSDMPRRPDDVRSSGQSRHPADGLTPPVLTTDIGDELTRITWTAKPATFRPSFIMIRAT